MIKILFSAVVEHPVIQITPEQCTEECRAETLAFIEIENSTASHKLNTIIQLHIEMYYSGMCATQHWAVSNDANAIPVKNHIVLLKTKISLERTGLFTKKKIQLCPYIKLICTSNPYNLQFLIKGVPHCSYVGTIFLCIIQLGHKGNEMVWYCAVDVWH